MNKSKKNPIRDTEKALIIKKVAKKFRVTERAVYKAINGESESDLALQLKAEFLNKKDELKKVFGK